MRKERLMNRSEIHNHLIHNGKRSPTFMMFNDTLRSLIITYYNVNLIGSQNFAIIGSSASYLSVLILSSLVLVCKVLNDFNSLMSKPDERL